MAARRSFLAAGVLVVGLLAGRAVAQMTSDAIPAAGGNVLITPIYHASLQIEHAGTVIQVDPWGADRYAAAKSADLILITHDHQDHLDPAAIARISKPGAPIVAPAAAAQKIAGALVMASGDSRTVAGVAIEALPAYNLTRGPSPGQLFHPKGRGNGYVLTLGGKRLYIAGDTECTPEMRALKNIDVAFLPMNLPYTMTPAEAAECARTFMPGIVYPYHYRGSDLEAFAAPLKGLPVEVRIRDWYPADEK